MRRSTWNQTDKSYKKNIQLLSKCLMNIKLDEIFKFPSHLDPFIQVNCLYELSSDSPKYPTQKWYIWASFQTSRKRFRKLQEAMWLTVINGLFKCPPNFNQFGYVNYLDELSLGYPNYPTQKWYIWASFWTYRKRFYKVKEAIWLTVINKIFKLPPNFDPFIQINYLCELSSGYPKYPTQK